MTKIFARRILGMTESVRSELYFCKHHNRNIDIPRLNGWIQMNASNDTVTAIRQILCIRNNIASVNLIAYGIDI